MVLFYFSPLEFLSKSVSIFAVWQFAGLSANWQARFKKQEHVYNSLHNYKLEIIQEVLLPFLVVVALSLQNTFFLQCLIAVLLC